MPPRAAQPVLPLTPNQVMAKRRAAVAGACKNDPIHAEAMKLCQEVEQWFINGETESFHHKAPLDDFDGRVPSYVLRAHSLLMTSGWSAFVSVGTHDDRELPYAVLTARPPWVSSDQG